MTTSYLKTNRKEKTINLRQAKNFRLTRRTIAGSDYIDLLFCWRVDQVGVWKDWGDLCLPPRDKVPSFEKAEDHFVHRVRVPFRLLSVGRLFFSSRRARLLLSTNWFRSFLERSSLGLPASHLLDRVCVRDAVHSRPLKLSFGVISSSLLLLLRRLFQLDHSDLP